MRCFAEGDAHDIPIEDGPGAYCPEHGVTLLWRGDPITSADVPRGPWLIWTGCRRGRTGRTALSAAVRW